MIVTILGTLGSIRKTRLQKKQIILRNYCKQDIRILTITLEDFTTKGLITIEKEDTLSSDIIVLFLNDLFYNFSKKRYPLLLDSGLKDVLTDMHKSKNQNYKLHVMDELRSTERSAQDRIKRKNNFYKYVDKAVSGLENMEKIVAMVESKSLDNFISR